jgi:hypothetical protein
LNPIRAAGSVLGLVAGISAALVDLYEAVPHPLCLAGLCSGPVPPPDLHGSLLVVGALLAVVSLVSFVGVRTIFAFGAILAAALLAVVLLTWGAYTTDDALFVGVFSVVTLVVDAIALMPSKALSEKDSPLNLPVFG